MELGSYFELDISSLFQTEDNLFLYLSSYNSIYMDSGRSATAVLNKVLKQGTILLPSYICESVINVYKKWFTIRFYKINKDFSVDIKDFEKKLKEGAAIVYIMHYFGQLQDKDFLEYLLKKRTELDLLLLRIRLIVFSQRPEQWEIIVFVAYGNGFRLWMAGYCILKSHYLLL